MPDPQNLPPVIPRPPDHRSPGRARPVVIAKERETVFSAPRKFDTATILIVTFCYAIGLGFLLGVGVPVPEVCATIAFFTVVGICQPILFRGTNPRGASVLGGGIGAVLVVLIVCRGEWVAAVCVLIPSVFVGMGAGYFAGALVGGIFLVTHHVREFLEGRKEKPDEPDEFVMEGPEWETDGNSQEEHQRESDS